MVKKASVTGKSAPKAAGRAAAKGTAAKRAVVPTNKPSTSSGVLVKVANVGGYRVFGSDVRPKHVTEEQIAEALASLK
ncbi:MAG: hypothetical protein JSR59_21775 [Proteobacteria bacterium]|nr:hypothetical protein [Pseudomonadota bacterium]